MSKLWIESDGTAAGTSVFVNENELSGVRRIEIIIEADGTSSVAIETDESEREDSDCCCDECCDECEEVDETPAPVAVEVPVNWEEAIKKLVEAQGQMPSGARVVGQEEAKEVLRKLLDSSIVDAAKGVLVMDMRQ